MREMVLMNRSAQTEKHLLCFMLQEVELSKQEVELWIIAVSLEVVVL